MDAAGDVDVNLRRAFGLRGRVAKCDPTGKFEAAWDVQGLFDDAALTFGRNAGDSEDSLTGGSDQNVLNDTPDGSESVQI